MESNGYTNLVSQAWEYGILYMAEVHKEWKVQIAHAREQCVENKLRYTESETRLEYMTERVATLQKEVRALQDKLQVEQREKATCKERLSIEVSKNNSLEKKVAELLIKLEGAKSTNARVELLEAQNKESKKRIEDLLTNLNALRINKKFKARRARLRAAARQASRAHSPPAVENEQWPTYPTAWPQASVARPQQISNNTTVCPYGYTTSQEQR